MGIAKFKITFERLRDVLFLPKDTEILRIIQTGEFQEERMAVIMVEHPDLPERNEGDVIRNIEPIWRRRCIPEFEGWNILDDFT